MTYPPDRVLVDYRLPDGTIVRVDDSAAKGEPSIDFTLRGGTIVKAVRCANSITGDPMPPKLPRAVTRTQPSGYAIEIRLVAYAEGRSVLDQGHYRGSLTRQRAAHIYSLLNAILEAKTKAEGQ